MASTAGPGPTIRWSPSHRAGHQPLAQRTPHAPLPRAPRLLPLAAVATLLLTGGVVFGPTPAYAAERPPAWTTETRRPGPRRRSRAGMATAGTPLAPLQAERQRQDAEAGTAPGHRRGDQFVHAHRRVGPYPRWGARPGGSTTAAPGATGPSSASTAGTPPIPARPRRNGPRGPPTACPPPTAPGSVPPTAMRSASPAGSSALTVHLAREMTALRVPCPSTRRRPRRRRRTATGPAINPRSSWGAPPPKEAYDYAHDVEHAIVHHSVTARRVLPRRRAQHPALHPGVPPGHAGLERHRLQLRRRQVRRHLGGAGGGITSTVIGGHALGANTPRPAS